MIDLKRDLKDLVRDISAGKISATDLVNQCQARIKETKDYHTVLELNPAALERAHFIDQQIKKGKIKGRLLGLPYIAKDNFLTHQTHTTAASRILEPFRAPYQATVIEKLEAEGAILLAKANLDAFAHGSSTENSDFGPTKNPWDKTKVPGGSSGGSAAAVALSQAAFAIGTDTGGSIRLPASYCGVVGLKPTYGLISRNGVIAMASSTDVIGPLTRNVGDAALVLDVMASRDVMDATTIDREATSYTDFKTSVKGLKVGLIREYLAEGVDPGVRERILDTAERLKNQGARVSEMSLPSVDLALACYYILVPAEISSNLARYDGVKYGYNSKRAANLDQTYELSRGEGFGDEAKRRIMVGTYVLSSGYYDAYYKQAQKIRTLLRNEFDRAFSKFDLLLAPTAPTTAFGLGEKSQDPLAMYLCDVLTVAVNLVGNCAISLPAMLHQGLPVGLQLIGPQQGERQLLGAAAATEQLLGRLELKSA